MSETKKDPGVPILLVSGIIILIVGAVMLYSAIDGISEYSSDNRILADMYAERIQNYNSIATVSYPIIGAGFFMTMFGFVIRTLREIKLNA